MTVGGLAQLGERLICIQEVSGSIPLSSTIDTFLFFQIVNKNYQYLYPIVRIDEQSTNVRIDEHSNKI